MDIELTSLSLTHVRYVSHSNKCEDSLQHFMTAFCVVSYVDHNRLTPKTGPKGPPLTSLSMASPSASSTMRHLCDLNVVNARNRGPPYVRRPDDL